jgi:enoyl-CoA hydratase/carnithine racemase
MEGFGYCLSGLFPCSCPFISMVFGPAMGTGLDLAVISDFRIAEDP